MTQAILWYNSELKASPGYIKLCLKGEKKDSWALKLAKFPLSKAGLYLDSGVLRHDLGKLELILS